MPEDGQLEITFLGGADEIGASSALVTAGGTSVLVDCGVRFRAGRELPDLDALTGRRLDAILVTHAHSDHTGGLPVVHEAYPATPIHMTPPTLDLVRILQRDALRLMAADREAEVPLYPEEAVESMLQVVRTAGFSEPFPVGTFEATFLPASHILGAAMVHLATPAGSVLFTGDYSVEAQRTVPALDIPSLGADMVVTESTYGDRLHADRRAAERRLVERVRDTVEAGGRVLIPAFAIGRAQEVILILRRALERGDLPGIPVFVDGMVRAVCEVYSRHPRFVTNALARPMEHGHPFYSDTIRPVSAPDERRKVLAAGPCAIVSSSGMLSGGPSAFYASEMAPVEADAILVTGYQDEESPGRALLRLAGSDGPRTLRLGDREVEVRCSFDTYGLSAHADRMQMVGLLDRLRPGTVVLVHGDTGAKRSLAGTLACADIVHARNGDRVARAWAGRRRGPPPPRRNLEVDPERARRLVAGAPGGVVPVSRVARAFFGRKAPAPLVDRLVHRLAELGIARRDDDRRGLLRILAGDPAEDALAEELKAENPKGRLLEYCMRRGIEPPDFVARPAGGGRHTARATLVLDEREIDSGEHVAAAPRVAEQLAARALLESIAEGEEPGGEEVDEAAEAALRRENPKGTLLERCATARLPVPEFEVRPLAAGGFAGRVRLDCGSREPLVSGLHRAGAAKTVEQAAARDLIARMPEGLASPPDGEAGRGPDARLALNRYRQTGQLADYGYEHFEARGPSHRPEFVALAWAETAGGRRYESVRVTAGSKKEVERRAAADLLARIRGT